MKIRFDKSDPNGSNGSSPDNNVKTEFTGTVEIDGYKARYGEDENGDIVVETPEDLPADKLDSFTKKAEEAEYTLASAKRKNHELNQEKEELNAQRRKLEQERAELEAQKRALANNAPQPAAATPDEEMLKRHFGVNSWDEVEEMRTDDPGKFYRANVNYQAEIAARSASHAAALETIKSQIRSEKHDPEAVMAFAIAKGISDLNTAYDYYKRLNVVPAGKTLSELNKERKVRVAPASKGNGTGNPAPAKVQPLKEVFSNLD